jgi:hypothetical protein
MKNLAIDGLPSAAKMQAEFAQAISQSPSASVQLIQLLSFSEAKQQSCPKLDATIQVVCRMAESTGAELRDWRLRPNGERFDLLIELSLPNNNRTNSDLFLQPRS